MRSCVQDIPALKYVTRINGLTHINLTKLDVLSDLPVLQVRTRNILAALCFVPLCFCCLLFQSPSAVRSQHSLL